MMDNLMIPAVLIVALICALILGVLFGKKGFWRGVFWIFLIIFLVGWSGQLWISPFGPVWLGVSWYTLLFTVLIFSFLIIALSPATSSSTKERDDTIEASGIVLGTFFWFLIVILITSIVFGYYRLPPIV